jgi:hypothetical protein
MCTAAVTIITAVIGIAATTVTAGGTIISPDLWSKLVRRAQTTAL